MNAAAKPGGVRGRGRLAEPLRRQEQACDVLVVGAGVVGLATALGLARSGLQVTLVSDRAPPNWRADTLPGRVSTLNEGSSLWLAGLGLAPAGCAPADAPQPEGQLDRVAPVCAMQVWDARSSAEIRFEGDAERPLAFTVEHSMLEAALWKAAERAGVVGRFGQRGRHFDLGLDHLRVVLQPVSAGPSDAGEASGRERWRCRWIVAADGAGSGWRDRLGIASRRIDDGARGIVATLAPEWTHQQTAFQRFDGDDIVALLPLAEGRVSLVWSRPDHAAEDVLALDRKAFDTALTAASGGVLGHLSTLSTPRAWPIIRHHALRYGACFGRGGVLLAGDAAHTIHPLAGQGLNLGLADASALVALLSTAVPLLARPEAVLADYEAARRPDNAVMRLSMEGFKRVFSASSPIVKTVRGLGVRSVAGSAALREAFRAAAAGGAPTGASISASTGAAAD